MTLFTPLMPGAWMGQSGFLPPMRAAWMGAPGILPPMPGRGWGSRDSPTYAWGMDGCARRDEAVRGAVGGGWPRGLKPPVFLGGGETQR